MLKVTRALLSSVLIGVAASGCGAPATPDAPAPANRSARAARPVIPPAPREATVKILSIDPDVITVRHGSAVPGDYQLQYSIGEPAKVEEAKLTVYAPGLDDIISKQDVPIVASGAINVSIAPDFKFGPTLRFRARCPEGTTDWYTYGREPLPYEQRMAPGLKIAGVGPDSIFYNLTGNTGGSVRITLFGQELTPECTAEGQVDGRPVQLSNTLARRQTIETLLRRDDFGDTAVAKRYLEVKLSIHGPRFAKVAIAHVRFVE